MRSSRQRRELEDEKKKETQSTTAGSYASVVNSGERGKEGTDRKAACREEHKRKQLLKELRHGDTRMDLTITLVAHQLNMKAGGGRLAVVEETIRANTKGITSTSKRFTSMISEDRERMLAIRGGTK